MKLTRSKIYIPAPIYPTPPLWVRLLKVLGIFTACTIAYIVVLAILFDYFTGCQSKIYHENGTWETQSCLFIPYTPQKGRWH